MPKNKSHKGLLKRVRVSKTGKIKLQRAYGRHLRSHKPGQKTRGYRRPMYASAPDMRKLRSLLGLKTSAGNGKVAPAAETPTES